MNILKQKTPKKALFSPIFVLIVSFSCLACLNSCSKSSISETEQLAAFAKKNNITYVTDPSGLMYQIIAPGSGTKPRATSTVSAAYVGTFMNDKIFDSTSKPIEFPLNQVIKGWQIGLQLIAPGGEIKLLIPSSLGYGPDNYNLIPGGSPLYFNVKLSTIKTY